MKMTKPPKLPDPPVPADADLRRLRGIVLDIDRLMASELWALSTGDEFKAALALWMAARKQVPAGSLPDDERVLRAFSGAGRLWLKIRDMALHGFVKCSDGRLYHLVLCEDVARALKDQEVYVARRDRDAERLRKWRTKRDETPPETPPETRFTSKHKGQGQGQGQDSLKGEAKQESHIETSESAAAREGFSKSEGGLGRYAPSEPPPPDTAEPAEAQPPTEEEKAEVAAQVDRAVAALNGSVPKGIRDPAAYAATVKASKFKTLTRNVGAWVGTGLDGPARWAAWEVMAEIESVGSRSEMAPAVRKSFDGLVAMYRAASGSEAKEASTGGRQ